ncbi:MAG TPA: zf-HC2 domain-containing protein [Pyrinomonadaceae bacterium]|nr:zf-HC2 domain-containing protein [Pyrinomonadaceae bacterium]
MTDETRTIEAPKTEATVVVETGVCLRDVAAYLDGELDAEASARFEQHARLCAPCTDALREQRRLLCVLDVAFGDSQRQMQLPANFTQVVKARAQSDMSSVRRGSERKRAALVVAGLVALSFALLGWQAWDELFAPLRTVAGVLGTILDMATNAVGEALAGIALMLRVLGGQLLNEPGAFRTAMYVILALGIVLLFRLIGNYHRTPRLPD